MVKMGSYDEYRVAAALGTVHPNAIVAIFSESTMTYDVCSTEDYQTQIRLIVTPEGLDLADDHIERQIMYDLTVENGNG